MPIPPLDAYGLLPAGEHPATLTDIAAAFCWSAWRADLWQDCCLFIDWMRAQNALPDVIYIDGSFSTDKPVPGDIDVVFDLTSAPLDVAKNAVFLFGCQRAAIKQQYHVDFWVFAPGWPKDLRSFFQYVGIKTAQAKGLGAKDPKGIVRVVSP